MASLKEDFPNISSLRTLLSVILLIDFIFE